MDSTNNNRWLIIGGAVVAVLLIGFILFNLLGGQGATPTPVPTSGAQINAPFVGPAWEWTGTTSQTGSTVSVAIPSSYTIQFASDGTYTGKADCNSISGTYAVNGTALQINPGVSTLVGCPAGSLGDLFVSQLTSVASYNMLGTQLTLNLKADAGNMHMLQQGAATTTAVATGVIVTTTPLVTLVPATTTALPTPAQKTITPTPPPNCPGNPVIQFFVAQPPTIQLGQNTVLSWGEVSNATAVAIDQGIGGVAAPGSTIVSPKQTTTYTMTATGCGGTAQSVLTVTVNQPTAPPPPTAVPTQPPTAVPTAVPTQVPTEVPTEEPTEQPTEEPTEVPGADLIGTWKWTGTTLTDGTNPTPSDPSQYTALFNANGSIRVQADCNTGNGSYTVNGNALTIQVGIVTQVACGDESLSQEFISLLNQAASYSVQGNALTIQLQAGAGTMSFTK